MTNYLDTIPQLADAVGKLMASANQFPLGAVILGAVLIGCIWATKRSSGSKARSKEDE